MIKQFEYVFRYLLNGRGSSLVKIISLTLGLVVSLVLYTQIAFEFSYDSFYPDSERIYRIRHINQNGEKPSFEDVLVHTPMPGCIKSDIRGVEDACLSAPDVELKTFLSGDKQFVEKVLNVDSSFMDVFRLPVLSGDIRKMALPYQVFLSGSAAQRMFGDSDPVGETLTYMYNNSKKLSIVVAGVFEDFPENASFRADMLLSIQTLFAQYGGEPGWDRNQFYLGYVKLSPGITPKEVEAPIPAMLSNYYKVKEKDGAESRYQLDPLTSLHKTNPDVRKRMIILGVLAFSLLFVSAMNYVLISISSLVKRSKLIGVYKTCGATNTNIFIQFMLETVILIAVSLVLSGFLIFALRVQIEDLIQTSMSALFSSHNLWVVGILFIVLLLIAGVIPARLFSATPATHVFSAIAINKRYWKNLLLFVQFLSITCMSCVLFVIIRQYDMMVNRDWGYQMDKLLYVRLSGVPNEQLSLIKSEFKSLSYVSDATLSSNIPMFGMNGDGISDPETKEQMFSYKLMGADKDFFNTFRIALQSGKCFEKDGDSEEDVIVNEAFAHMLETHQFPLDGYFLNIDGKRRITGIVQDFRLTSLYDETMPLMITSVDPLKGYWLFGDYYLTVRLDNYSPGELDEMNKKLLALTQNEVLAFTAYKDTWRNAYDDARLFQNSVIASSVIMLLITLLGLIAYVEDEIFRRHKEIAIRKINGATIKNVLAVVSKDFSFVVIPAMIVGSLLSYVLAQEWLRQFSVQVSLPLLLFILTCVSLLGFLLGCIYLRSWSAANENPVNSIKVE